MFGQHSTIQAIVNAPTLHKKASKEVLGISLLQNSTESTTIPTGPSVFHTTTSTYQQCSVAYCWCQARPFSCPSHLWIIWTKIIQYFDQDMTTINPGFSIYPFLKYCFFLCGTSFGMRPKWTKNNNKLLFFYTKKRI